MRLDCESLIHEDFIPLFVTDLWHPCSPLNGKRKYLTRFEWKPHVDLISKAMLGKLLRGRIKHINMGFFEAYRHHLELN